MPQTHRLVWLSVILLWATSISAAPRETIAFDAGWHFALQPAGKGFEQPSFDDSTWATISVPHTWNAIDGQDGGTYVRGDGWYRRTFTADPAWKGRRVFLQFDAVNRVADVYLNGRLLGHHAGGYTRFRFDLTDGLLPGNNVLAVRANNEANNTFPLGGDFTMDGGIYRHVALVLVSPQHIAMQDHGSPGVFVTPQEISTDEAGVAVRTLLEDSGLAWGSARVAVRIFDATGKSVASSEAPANAAENVQHLAVVTPHLWQGRERPYLYRVRVELRQGATVLDAVEQPLGFRRVRIDPDKGFFLNDRHTELHGVNYHQDMMDRGYAVADADRERDFAIMTELGVTTIRLCHYPHDERAYDLCDRLGILAWAEFPFVFDTPTAETAPACLANAREQLREFIRQNYNHPAIFCWSIGNETSNGHLDLAEPILRALNAEVKEEDPTRPTSYASHHGDDDPRNFIPDVVGFNRYYGWYTGQPSQLAERLDNFHRKYPQTAMAITEYGAGASIFQHEQHPPFRSKTQARGPWHPEEWQDEVHEASWLTLSNRPFIWATYLWVMFDFASDGRSEGDHAGRNDKGLVTYDRRVRKDAYYWYQANWTTTPMVYLTSRRDTLRLEARTDVKAYSNCESVELFVNGVSRGTLTSTDHRFVWKDIELAPGSNRIAVEARSGAVRITDSCAWVFTPGTPYHPPTDEEAAAKK
ncbi:MAG TPA: glycoside hydrolase family 2 TIM barrel-domain containing protein [Candidatus Didemnitutus sp.]|nr:glycoside hydrolase family 2 TIM barrel-domain containing protein [Candidatus Didemnitutus sp.]